MFETLSVSLSLSLSPRFFCLVFSQLSTNFSPGCNQRLRLYFRVQTRTDVHVCTLPNTHLTVHSILLTSLQNFELYDNSVLFPLRIAQKAIRSIELNLINCTYASLRYVVPTLLCLHNLNLSSLTQSQCRSRWVARAAEWLTHSAAEQYGNCRFRCMFVCPNTVRFQSKTGRIRVKLRCKQGSKHRNNTQIGPVRQWKTY